MGVEMKVKFILYSILFIFSFNLEAIKIKIIKDIPQDVRILTDPCFNLKIVQGVRSILIEADGDQLGFDIILTKPGYETSINIAPISRKNYRKFRLILRQYSNKKTIQFLMSCLLEDFVRIEKLILNGEFIGGAEYQSSEVSTSLYQKISSDCFNKK